MKPIRQKLLMIVSLLALLLGLFPVESRPVQAVSDTIVISQVYGGGGNTGATYRNDFIELYNRGSSIVDVTGWTVQYGPSTGSTWVKTTLSGTIEPGKYYLIQEALGAGGTLDLPTPNVIGTIPMAAANGKVALVNNDILLIGACPTGVVDFVGYGAANCSETSPTVALSNTTAALRKNNGTQDTDNNSIDFDILAPNPRNSQSSDAAPAVASTDPLNGAINVPSGTNITVTFTEAVVVTNTWYTLSCSLSGAHTANFSGGPTTFSVNPDTDLTLGDSCTFTVLADQVSDQDSIDPPDNMAANFSITFSTANTCTLVYTPIYDIQGSGLSAATSGSVTTQGVVVGDFEGSASGSGFYLQDLTGDGNTSTSDGIFVYTGSSDLVSAGQVVRVTGYARERFNQTTLNGSDSNTDPVPGSNIVECGTGSVPPTDITLPFANLNDPERYEGMLVRFPQPLVIAEYFNYDRFGEIVLAQPLNGETRPFTGTAVETPGTAANARTLANSLRRITLDDANNVSNPPVLRHPNGLPFSLTNRFRGGDIVQNTIGVLGYGFNLYRIYPTGPAQYTAANPRPAAPEPAGGTLRVAAMNTLNFFVTADYPTGSPLDNKCGPANNVECRGWDFDQTDEFTRQRTKLLAALTGLNADVIGLNELENTTGVEPLENLLLGLPGYGYINTGVIGTDAIKVGLIYRTDVVTPIGDYKLLTTVVDPRFLDTKNRPSLAQTFQVNASGVRFTVVVNHFKSKGSDCIDVQDPDLGDGQGNCSNTRRAAAEALVDWLNSDPTGSGDPDFLILGDLNSYAMEDPITAIKKGADDTAGTADDFTNLIGQYQGKYAYSYTYDGQAGYLDHALASTSMLKYITGAADWHINSDEPGVLDYDTSFKPNQQDALYEPNAYRTSDHDPVIVSLNFEVHQLFLPVINR